MKKLEWKIHKGIKYANAGDGVFWLIYPSGHKGQWFGEDENALRIQIDQTFKASR